MKVFLESLPLEYINYNMLIHISFHHINISVTWSLCPANQARERVVNGEDDEEDDEAVPAAKVSACARVRVPHESARDTHTHINTHTHTHTRARARAHTHTQYAYESARVCARYAEWMYYTNRNTQATHTMSTHEHTHHTTPHVWVLVYNTHATSGCARARACLRECVSACGVCANESEGAYKGVCPVCIINPKP